MGRRAVNTRTRRSPTHPPAVVYTVTILVWLNNVPSYVSTSIFLDEETGQISTTRRPQPVPGRAGICPQLESTLQQWQRGCRTLLSGDPHPGTACRGRGRRWGRVLFPDLCPDSSQHRLTGVGEVACQSPCSRQGNHGSRGHLLGDDSRSWPPTSQGSQGSNPPSQLGHEVGKSLSPRTNLVGRPGQGHCPQPAPLGRAARPIQKADTSVDRRVFSTHSMPCCPWL